MSPEKSPEKDSSLGADYCDVSPSDSGNNPYQSPEGEPDDLNSMSGEVGTFEKVGYGLGDTASNLYWNLFQNFQLIFYTDVFGISAGTAATMFLVTKLWDAINDPLIGALADRTKTAWGRFRPYLIWMSIPFAVTGILSFHTPDLSPGWKVVYAYVTYTLVFTAYTAINVPYGALMGVISSNSLERTSVSTYRFMGAFLGGLIVQVCTEPLVAFFGGTATIFIDGEAQIVVVDKQTGYFWAVACYAALAVVLFFITFATTKERVTPTKQRSGTFKHDLRDLFRNRAWFVLVLVGGFQILGGWTRGSAIAFYFTYSVGGAFGMFLAMSTLGSLVGIFATKPLTALLGKKKLMQILIAIVAVLTGGFFFLEPEQIVLIYALNILLSIVAGPMPVLIWAMFADAADYSEWQNGRRATGLIFSAASLSQKMGGALGSAIPGWVLAYYSFKAPVDGVQQVQSDQTLAGILLMISLIPTVFLVLSGIAMAFYPLRDELMVEIESDLQKRKLEDSRGREH